jgi:hypothetical protein
MTLTINRNLHERTSIVLASATLQISIDLLYARLIRSRHRRPHRSEVQAIGSLPHFADALMEFRQHVHGGLLRSSR